MATPLARTGVEKSLDTAKRYEVAKTLLSLTSTNLSKIQAGKIHKIEAMGGIVLSMTVPAGW